MVGVQRDFNLQLQRSTNTFFAEQGWSFLLGAETLAELALRFDVDEDAKSDTPVDSLQELGRSLRHRIHSMESAF